MAQILDLGKIRFNWAGTYGAINEYSYNDLVKYGPNLYAYTATTASTGVEPTDGSKWAVVVEGIFYKGVYTSGTKYFRNDVVIDGQNTYITVTEHTASSNVALGNTNLEIIALGQEGLPSQAGKTNQLLSTDGTEATWTATPHISKEYVGNSQGQAAVDFESSAELTNAIGVYSSSATDFAQMAMVNTTNAGAASTDYIAYTADGTNNDGFIDMGITSRDFDSETFGITGPHDGYIFMSAPRGQSARNVTLYTVIAGTATITTQTSHTFIVGNTITVYGVSAAIDGTHVVTAVPNATKVSFATAAPSIGETATPGATVHKPTGAGNLVLATDGTGSENAIVFAAGGYQSGTAQMTIYPNNVVDVTIDTQSTSNTTGALVVAGGVGITKNAHVGGDLQSDGLLYVGSEADEFTATANLTDPMAVFAYTGGGTGSYAQFAVHNSEPTSSTDVILYMDNGTDSTGWMGMGITGSQFDDATYGITGPGDGYIFHDTKNSSYHGNLVIATGESGSQNKIIFAAGGYASGNTQMAITPDVNVHIDINTPSTSPTTGALTVIGGVGIQGDVNIAGNIVFGGEGTQVGTANLAVTAPFIFTGDGNTTQNYDLGLVTEGKYVLSGSIKGIPTRYVVNKQLQTNVATLITAVAHKFEAGDSVTIANVDATFNGTYTIVDVPSSTSFTYAKTASDVASTRIGDETFSIDQKSLVSNIATLQTTATHTYIVGDSVVVTGVDSTFNGTYTITAVTTNTFSYAKTSINVSAAAVSPVGTSVVNRTVATALVSSATRTRYNAMYKDHSDNYIKFVTNLSTKPSETVDLTQATYGTLDVGYDSVKVGGIVIQGGTNEPGSLTLQGDIRKAAWTTNGVRHISVASTLTDTTSSGVVPLAYTNVFGGNTIAAVNSATYTEYGTMHVKAPTAGTNVTFTNSYSVVTDGAIKNGGTLKQVGAATFDSTLNVTGNVNVNSNKFNITAANGNTSIDGTLAVTGATTLSSTLSVPSALSTLNGGISSSGTVTFTGGVAMSGTTDIQEMRETVVDVTLSGGTTGTLDWTLGNIYYIGTAPSGAMTFNVTNVPTDASKIMTINVFVTQGSTGYIPSTFQIAGASQTIRWPGGTAPTATSTAGKIDVFSFTMMRTSGGAWIVYGNSSLNY